MAGPNAIHPLVRAFADAMRGLGYVEGENPVLERRSAEGRFEGFDEIVVGLVRRNVDVIVTTSNTGTGRTRFSLREAARRTPTGSSSPPLWSSNDCQACRQRCSPVPTK